MTFDTRIHADKAGSGLRREVGWRMRGHTEATGRDVGGDKNRNFARFELGHDAERNGREKGGRGEN